MVLVLEVERMGRAVSASSALIAQEPWGAQGATHRMPTGEGSELRGVGYLGFVSSVPLDGETIELLCPLGGMWRCLTSLFWKIIALAFRQKS